jgi:ankyrin repeat protein
MDPTHYAALLGHLEVLDVLVKQNKLSVTNKCRKGRTPLHLAAMHGHLHVVQYLLRIPGVSVLEVDKDFLNPVFRCASATYAVLRTFTWVRLCRTAPLLQDNVKWCVVAAR